MADIKKLLAIKKAKGKPKFNRDGYIKRKKIGPGWRKPKGVHSKLRHQFAGHSKKVMPGFRTDKRIRGVHLSGLLPVLIKTIKNLESLDKNTHGAIVANVGMKKKIELLEALKKQGIVVLNLKEDYISKAQAKLKERQAARDEKASKKTEKEKKAAKEKKKKVEKKLTEEEKIEKEKKEKDKIMTKGDQ